MDGQVFRNLYSGHNQRIMLCPSLLGDRFETGAHPVFLYHARRTAGITFYYALFHALNAVFSYMKLEDRPQIGRVESADLDGSVFKRFFALVGSHADFGIHKLFHNNFRLAALVRDPFPRIRSTYLSGCMRNNNEPTLSGFESFYSDVANINGMTRQLCGLSGSEEKITSYHFDVASQVLRDFFHSFCSNHLVEDLICEYLTSMGMPNVVMEKPNQTLPSFYIDMEETRLYIEELNAVDHSLYSLVSEAPKLSGLALNGIEISPMTVVIHERERATRSAAVSIAMPTARFLDVVSEHPNLLDDLGGFWEPELGLDNSV